MQAIEYRVRPVTRFIVTRYERHETGGSCIQKGEFLSEKLACEVARALADSEEAECFLEQPKG